MQRNLRRISDADLWDQWREDIERIKRDAFQLFSARRTFRELVAVYTENHRLQDVGGHLWEWLRANYAAFVIMRIRRETDGQGHTVNLNRLLAEIEQRPGVITRARRRQMLRRGDDSSLLSRLLDDEFTRNWVRAREADEADDAVDPQIVAADRDALQLASGRVRLVANLTVAHRTRVEPAALSVPEVDAVFDVIETTLTKYYALLQGASLVGLEPTPQFDTLEVFTFPWLVPRGTNH